MKIYANKIGPSIKYMRRSWNWCVTVTLFVENQKSVKKGQLLKLWCDSVEKLLKKLLGCSDRQLSRYFTLLPWSSGFLRKPKSLKISPTYIRATTWIVSCSNVKDDLKNKDLNFNVTCYFTYLVNFLSAPKFAFIYVNCMYRGVEM